MPKSLFNSFLGRKILKPINEQIINSGFSTAFNLVLKKTNTLLKVSYQDQKTKKCLTNKPCLIIANHPAEAELLGLLAALPTRSDFYLIVNNSFISVLPAFDPHLIPVYINEQIAIDQKNQWKQSILKKFHHTPTLDPEIAHRKNIESINLAAKKINQGGSVVIFPLSDGNHGHFYPGVGYIVKGLKKPQTVNVVFSYLSGSSDFDYLRIFPLIGKILPVFRVKFSSAFNAADFVGIDGKSSAKNLEIAYYAWVESIKHQIIKPPIAFRAVNRSYLLFRSLLLWLFNSH